METEEQSQQFELIVGEPSGEILNGDVPVRWCVTPELVAKLEKDGIVDPHILLVSAHNGREMQRQLVPITELMTYVRFTKAGEMNLYGFIINGIFGRQDLYNVYNRKELGYYVTNIIFSPRPSFITDNHKSKTVKFKHGVHQDIPAEYCRTHVTVEIPAGVFGKEPSEWMKWFVNLWMPNNGKFIDECNYRKHMVLALIFKSLPVLLWATTLVTLRVLLVSIFVLSGYWKGVRFFRAFRPFKWNNLKWFVIPNWDDDNQLIFKRKQKIINFFGDECVKTVPMMLTVPFIPAVLLIQTLIVFATGANFVQTMFYVSGGLFILAIILDIIMAVILWYGSTQYFKKLHEVIGNILAVALGTKCSKEQQRLTKVIHIITAVTFVLSMVFLLIPVSSIQAIAIITLAASIALALIYYKNMVEKLTNMYTVTPENNNCAEIKELLCPMEEDNLVPNIDYIPPKQRTVRLWYLNIKNKVCKPMQQ